VLMRELDNCIPNNRRNYARILKTGTNQHFLSFFDNGNLLYPMSRKNE